MTTPSSSAPSAEMVQLREALAAIEATTYPARFHWTAWSAIRDVEKLRAKTQFLGDYTVYLLDRLERLEARVAEKG